MAESSPRRKIAVILATDVVGYSTKMEENEDQTLKNLKVCRNIIDGLVDEHHGRIFNTAGDSVLADFQSAVEAVICASEFQNTIKERNNSVPQEEQMEFRIGINMGDVVIEGDNLYGEGVNVAARLEALAQPGGVCLSKNVHEIVNKKTNFQFHDLGEQTVKNTVLHAVDVTLDGTSQRKLPESKVAKQSSTEKPPAIAVLPFANMSGDSEQEYFVDGITEDIITNLSLWKTFPVISRNSSFSFKGKSVNIKEVAKELRVRYVVEGSVRKSGIKVRITAQLIDAYEDKHLWSKKWDRDLDDIFEVQDEVSTAIAALVSPAVKGKEQVRVSRKQTSNMSAWDEYLRGLSCYNNHEPSDIVKKYCYKSIELDDSLSDSYILICNSLYQEIYGSYGSDRGLERNNKEEEFHKNALKSFQLDSENPEALIALSRSYNLKKDFENRIEYMKQALNINPNHADANYEYGLSLTTYKEFEKAKYYALIGLQLNPKQQRYYPIILCCVGSNEFEEALKYCNKSIEVDPKFTGAIGWKSSMLGHLDRLDEAKEILSDYLKLRPEIKNINDYEKVAPTVIKDILMEGLIKAGMPNE
jgi:adenylate cyclase